MVRAQSLKLLAFYILLIAHVCYCKHSEDQRIISESVVKRNADPPLRSLSKSDDSARLLSKRYIAVDEYTNADTINADTINIDDGPCNWIERKRRNTHEFVKREAGKEERGPAWIHKRVKEIREMVENENKIRKRRAKRDTNNNIDRKLDSLVFRYRLKRDDKSVAKAGSKEKAEEDMKIAQDVQRQIDKIKEETRNEWEAEGGPMKKREGGDKAERRLNFLLSLKSCGLR